jgi:hypothetical protein
MRVALTEIENRQWGHSFVTGPGKVCRIASDRTLL